MSDESTGWNFPSTSVHRMSTIGFPLITPCCIVFTMPFSTEAMNWFGIAPPKILSTNSNPSPRGSGSISMLQIGVLAVAAGLLHVTSEPLAAACGSSRGTRSWRGVVTSTPNLRFIRSIMHVEVRLAHPVHHGLVRLVRALDPEGRVLLAQPCEGGRQLVLVALGLGCDREREQRLGHLERRDRSPGRPSSRTCRRSSCGPAWRRRRCRRRRPRRRVSCSLPRSANSWPIALLRALRRVVDGRVRPHLAGEHAEHRDVADVRVGHGLEDVAR